MTKKKVNSLIALATITTISSIAITAQAAPFKDALGKVYIQDSGIVVGQKLIIGTDTAVIKNGVFNQCGILTVSAPSTTILMPSTITVNGGSVDVATLPVGVMPKCAFSATTGGYALSIPTTASFKTADGKVGIVGAANSAGAIVYDGVFKPRSITADKCGMASLGSAASPAPNTFTYGGMSYTKASLTVKVPDRCIGGTRYTPVGSGSVGGS
jgi:hypothetical protein